MYRIDGGRAPRYCDGISRRSFLQVGVAGMASVGLAGVARAMQGGDPAARPKKDTSVILLWLDGGAGHMDTWDMKPEAPAEYRGIWRPIKTNVPGVEFTELFPLQAKIADKFSVVRSLHHDDATRMGSTRGSIASRRRCAGRARRGCLRRWRCLARRPSGRARDTSAATTSTTNSERNLGSCTSDSSPAGAPRSRLWCA